MLSCRLGAAPHGGADCGGNRGVCVQRGLPGRPVGQVTWVTGEALGMCGVWRGRWRTFYMPSA